MTEDNDQTPLTEKVVSKCAKCKTTPDHEVISRSAEGIIEKVKCLACGSEHKHRPEKPKVPRKSTRQKKIDPARDFNLLIEMFKAKKPQRYSMAGLFRAGDVIDHSSFGVGVVISALNKRMEVIFSDQPRILVFNREEMEISR
jgi:hypothetical protein